MSRCHTRGSIFGARKRPSFLTFLFIFARFGRFGRFGIFGGFVSVVSVVSLVSVVSVVSFRSFRWFRFGGFVSLFRVLVHALHAAFNVQLLSVTNKLKNGAPKNVTNHSYKCTKFVSEQLSEVWSFDSQAY